MAGAQEELAPVFADVTPAATAIPMYSTLTGGRLEAISAGHLLAHLRGKVQLAAAVDTAAREGAGVFLEVGGSAVLAGPMRATLAGRAEVVPLLRRTTAASWEAPLSALGRLVELGVRVDLRRCPRPRAAAAASPTRVGPCGWPRTSSRRPPETSCASRTSRACAITSRVPRHRPRARLIELVLKATGAAALRDLVQVASLSRSPRAAPRARGATRRRPATRWSVRRRPAATRSTPPGARGRARGTGDAQTSKRHRRRCARSMTGRGALRLSSRPPSCATVRRCASSTSWHLATASSSRASKRAARRAPSNPALVDGAMQAIGAFGRRRPEGERPTYLGFAIVRVTVAPAASALRAWRTSSSESRRTSSSRARVTS
jgi:acyl transferase domain-containing protein